MESRLQNPEFRNNPENFHPCLYKDLNVVVTINHVHLFVRNYLHSISLAGQHFVMLWLIRI